MTQYLTALWRNLNCSAAGDRAASSMAIGISDERIAWIAPQADLPAFERAPEFAEYDGAGAWVTPGLVECHTHLVFGGNRADEFGRRLAGASYEEIARAGGGIVSTVNATRAASEDALFAAAAGRLRCLIAEGVTAVEIKSGYGLDTQTEAKMLRVARRLGRELPVSVYTTFLGAHALPAEYRGRPDEYIELVCTDMLPTLAEQGLVDAVDAFCENIAFSVAQCERVFETAARLGLPVKLHAEQLSNIGATQLATRYGALSTDHLEHALEADVAAMRRAGTVAVLLPAAYYCLRETQPPPIDLFRRHGVPMAISTDCNPGTAPAVSPLLTMNMACTLFGLSIDEALLAYTRHAAQALGKSDLHGTLEAGRYADFVLWDVDSLAELVCWLGASPCRAVIRHGRIVHEAPGMRETGS
ncbi:MAG: imidazolonepropionase [Burkholderiales bacterium]|nr:imidazolonepropionase [Burkholderiales bacterium]